MVLKICSERDNLIILPTGKVNYRLWKLCMENRDAIKIMRFIHLQIDSNSGRLKDQCSDQYLINCGNILLTNIPIYVAYLFDTLCFMFHHQFCQLCEFFFMLKISPQKKKLSEPTLKSHLNFLPPSKVDKTTKRFLSWTFYFCKFASQALTKGSKQLRQSTTWWISLNCKIDFELTENCISISAFNLRIQHAGIIATQKFSTDAIQLLFATNCWDFTCSCDWLISSEIFDITSGSLHAKLRYEANEKLVSIFRFVDSIIFKRTCIKTLHIIWCSLN